MVVGLNAHIRAVSYCRSKWFRSEGGVGLDGVGLTPPHRLFHVNDVVKTSVTPHVVQ
jgi:hypothetical protein